MLDHTWHYGRTGLARTRLLGLWARKFPIGVASFRVDFGTWARNSCLRSAVINAGKATNTEASPMERRDRCRHPAKLPHSGAGFSSHLIATQSHSPLTKVFVYRGDQLPVQNSVVYTGAFKCITTGLPDRPAGCAMGRGRHRNDLY
jgi:hypothetical protein